MPHFKLTLAYDGTAFVGWQRQADGVSIQALVESALSELDGRPVAVVGAGRTDAGVHALGQVASASLNRTISADTVVRAVNARLPQTVRVLEASDAAPEFHARFASMSKVYRYRLWTRKVLSPFERPYVWHVTGPTLDVDAMAEAAAFLEGTHDFSAFQAAGSTTRSAERTLFFSRVDRVPEEWPTASVNPDVGFRANGQAGISSLITYEVCGNGFLRHMVRTIVGSLVDVGRGRRSPSWMKEVLASKSRALAGETAPASGLFLVRVSYE